MTMKIVVILTVLFSCFFPGPPGSAYRLSPAAADSLRYVFTGAAACATECHNSDESGHQLDIWKKSKHAEAYSVLLSSTARSYARKAGLKTSPEESLLCLKCHSTGAGCDPASAGPSFSAADGVGCEACHKGEFRPRTWIIGEDGCRTCHKSEVHRVPDFIFVKALDLIAHPMPELDTLKGK